MFSGFGSKGIERIAKSFLGSLKRELFATRYSLSMPFAPAKYFTASRQCDQHKISQVDGFKKVQQIFSFVYVVSHPKVSRVLHQRQSAHYVLQSDTHRFVVYIHVPVYRCLYYYLKVNIREI